MAPTLADFNSKKVEETPLQDFNPKRVVSPAVNKATVNTLATYGAALSPQTDSTYNSITNELSYSPSSAALENIVKDWDAQNYEASFNVLKEILVDPNISDEQKKQAYANFSQHQVDSTLYNRVATAYTMAPSDGENDEEELIRIDGMSAINEVDSYNAWVQQNINALDNSLSPNWLNNFDNFMETIVPFADAAGQTFLNNKMAEAVGNKTGGVGNSLTTMLMLGEGKETLRKALASVPFEKRREVTQQLMNLINETKGSILSDMNKAKAISDLNQMLTPGGYTGTDYWVDNIFSLMDDTILLVPFTKAAKGLGSLFKGAKTTTEVGEVLRRGNLADEAIAAEEAAGEATQPQLMIEFKPSPVSYNDDIDQIIDNLPIEPTKSEIDNLRATVTNEVYAPNGMSIDNVINNLSVIDKLTASQVIDIRQAIGRIRDKRTKELNSVITPPRIDIAEAQVHAVRSGVQPTSIYQVVKDTNPAKHRAMHSVIMADTTDRSAQVLAGTSKVNVVSHDLLPEIQSGGAVKKKTEFTEADPSPNLDIVRQVDEARGDLQYKPAEKEALTTRVLADWKNTIGVTARSKMATLGDNTPDFNTVSAGVNFDMVYGPRDGGFKNAIEGIRAIKYALRKYGITEDNIEIVARTGDGMYRPVNPKQDMRNGDFLVRVKGNYRFSPGDVLKYSDYDNNPIWSSIDVRLGKDEGWGGIVQQVIPKGTVIDGDAFKSAVVAADKVAGLKRELDIMTKRLQGQLKKANDTQRNLFNSYIRKANQEEIPFNPSKLAALGLDDNSINAVRTWKELHDTIWYFTNADVNKTLRNRGYTYFVDEGTNTKLIVEEIPSGSRVWGSKYYSTENGGTIRDWTNDELDKLYAEGGTIGKLRKAEKFGDDVVEYVIVKQSPGNGYTRRINDNDDTLTYRHGYYHVRYTDPYYITKTFKDGNGTTHVHTISRAANIRDADAEVARLATTDTKSVYSWKPDDRNGITKFDNELDVMFSSGMSSQKLRGKRLDRVGSMSTVADTEIETPFEALARSISSTAARVNYRDVIDTAKKRWMGQFKHLLKDGQFTYPTNLEQINGTWKKWEINNARNTWRWIEAMESGYTNLLDDLSKSFFNTIGDIASAKGWQWMDKGAKKLSKEGPSGVMRRTSFKLALASNPDGQLLLQAAPAFAVTSATNPTFWVRGRGQLLLLNAANRGIDVGDALKYGNMGVDPALAKEIVKDYRLSGISSAVDAHSYLQDDIGRLVEKNTFQKAAGVANTPFRFLQKIGFNFGEQNLMNIIWLSERDRLTRKLKRNTLTSAERDDLTARVRAMTADMNKGGDMPYNSNVFSLTAQYLQATHKTVAYMLLGHRGLDRKDRAKLIAGYVATFGVGYEPLVNKIIDTFNIEDETTKDVIKGGLISVAFNKMLSLLSGQDVKVAVGQRLNPLNVEPLIDFVEGIVSGTIPEALGSGAAPSLFASGGKISEFVKSVARAFSAKDVEGIDEWKQVGLSFLQMFSGMSNKMKAMYMLEANKIVSNSGDIVDQDVAYWEAMMKAAGFETWDEVEYWASRTASYEANDRIYGDVDQFLDEYFRMLNRENISAVDFDVQSNIMSEAMRVFRNNPKYLEAVSDKFSTRIRQNPDAFFRRILNNAGLYSRDEVVKITEGMPEEQRKQIMELFETFEEEYNGR